MDRWLALFGLAVVAGLIWLYLRRRKPKPCPASASFLLENPFTERRAGAGLLLDRADVGPGMRVLDVGCGPGRLSVPAAERVGPSGQVVALDVQQAMLEKLRRRVAERGLENVEVVHADVGAADLEPGCFDRALLVTVLGEVRDRQRAMGAIFMALRPGGLLSITEMLPDPDYQPKEKVRRLAEAAGFREAGGFGSLFAFTLNFVRPGGDGRGEGERAAGAEDRERPRE